MVHHHMVNIHIWYNKILYHKSIIRSYKENLKPTRNSASIRNDYSSDYTIRISYSDILLTVF